MVLEEAKVGARGGKTLVAQIYFSHILRQNPILINMVKVRTKLEGCFEKGCSLRGLLNFTGLDGCK
jgi:hypothetical protein